MSRHSLCNCPAGFSAEPEHHAPDCPGRSGAGKLPRITHERFQELMGNRPQVTEADREVIRIRAAMALSDFDKEDLITYAKEVVNLRAELAALKAGQGEAVALSDVIHHAYSRDRSVGWNAPEEEQALRAAFEGWLKTSQFSRPNSPWDIWKACAKATYTAPPVYADTVSVAPGLERAIQIVREVAKTQPGYSDEREAIFEALSEAYVEAMAPPCTSAAVMSVSIGLLRNICSMVPEKMKPARKELRALLAQSESKRVKS